MRFSPCGLGEKADPFILTLPYTVKSENLALKYVPFKISKDLTKIKKPYFIIDGKPISSAVEVDMENINQTYLRHVIDIIVFWIYPTAIFWIFFAFSGGFLMMQLFFVLIILLLTAASIFIIIRTTKEKRKLVQCVTQDMDSCFFACKVSVSKN